MLKLNRRKVFLWFLLWSLGTFIVMTMYLQFKGWVQSLPHIEFWLAHSGEDIILINFQEWLVFSISAFLNAVLFCVCLFKWHKLMKERQEKVVI